jgi:hypothetical protein
MATARQQQASRANGARSKGPVTAAGKARSALNALKHGLFAETWLLPGESEEEYQALREDYLATFQPLTVAELAAVDEMIAGGWRLRRVRAIEQAEFELALEELAEKIAERYPHATAAQRLALAYRRLSERGTVQQIERQEARLARLHDRAAARLDRIRQEHDAGEEAAVPEAGGPAGEPEPDWESEPEAEASAGQADSSSATEEETGSAEHESIEELQERLRQIRREVGEKALEMGLIPVPEDRELSPEKMEEYLEKMGVVFIRKGQIVPEGEEREGEPEDEREER